jgi:hypothetical protein
MKRAQRTAVTLALLVACGDDPTGPEYDPQLDPADFDSRVTNPFFPLVPGTTFSYEGETEEGTETVIVEVLDETRTILGITATVVRDRVFLDGELIEDTFDWFAQQNTGDVWYLGEDSKEIEDGEVVSTEGSWEAGVDGAKPGIVMWGDPAAHLNEEYRQEYYPDVAEDVATVMGLEETVEVPYGSFTGCIRTEDRNPLEPGTEEHKFYCPGVGLVLEGPTDGSEPIALVEVGEP